MMRMSKGCGGDRQRAEHWPRDGAGAGARRLPHHGDGAQLGGRLRANRRDDRRGGRGGGGASRRHLGSQQARGLIEATVARFGRLDVLVNNASIRRQTKFSELTVEEWREILGSTLDGAFYCVHAAAPHILAAGGGSIVNLGGISSHLGAKGRVHAITAKAGMVGLTRALAKELAPTITVNCVVPGSIDTVRGFAAGGNAGRASLPDNLAGRQGRPEEIAEMVRFLCSPVGTFITGQTIHVNGGAFMP